MLKHAKTIESLSFEQKLALLTDGGYLSRADGLPRLTFAYADTDRLPSFGAAANSWNPELFGRAWGAEAAAAAKEGASVLISQPINVTTGLYRRGLSEDPYLAGRMAAAWAEETGKSLAPCLASASLDETDARELDPEPDRRVIEQYLLAPFRAAAGAAKAVLTTFSRLPGGYRLFNFGPMAGLLSAPPFRDKFLMADRSDNAARSVNAGCALCLNGTAYELKEACDNYARLKNAVDQGLLSADELDAACLDGSAVSPDTIDGAVDTVLEFALSLGAKGGEYPAGDWARELTAQSAVLLKNERTLPLARGLKVAVIGSDDVADIADRLSAGDGLFYVGKAEGYRFAEERSDELIPPAVELANKADVVLLFLGAKSGAALPANQLALLDALSGTQAAIAAVVSPARPVDYAFDDDCAAVVLAPDGRYAAETLWELLTGKRNFSGKLACSCYADADARARELRAYKNAGRNKVGPFFGYRRYDAPAKYPFGFGLSYTTFAYSGMRIEGATVRFRVKNTGRAAGWEVAQVYAGKADSAYVRPERELKGFAKIFLKPGESRQVRIELNPDDLAIYGAGGPTVESGTYEAYLSLRGGGLEKPFYVWRGFSAGRPEKGDLSDYLQSQSNIVSGGYTMDVTEHKKRSKIKPFALLTLILALLCDLGAAGFGLLATILDWSLNPFERDSWLMVVVLAALAAVNILMLTAVAFWIADGVKARKKRALLANAGEVARENETIAEKEVPVEQLFLDEFKEEEVTETAAAPEDDSAKYIESGLDMRAAADRLDLYLKERGILASPDSIRALLSGMACSRLVLLPDAGPLTAPLIREIAGFFGSPIEAENVADGDGQDDSAGADEKASREPGDLLYAEDGQATVRRTLAAAGDDRHTAHIAYLRADPAGVSALSPLTRYFFSPETPCRIASRRSSERLSVPKNVWFFVLLSPAALDTLPAFAAEAGVVADVKLTRTAAEESKTRLRPLSFDQLVRLADDSRNGFALDEDGWKAVDRLEEYVSARAPFRMDNKFWQRLERFASVCLACGGGREEALDRVIAAKILPAALPALSNNAKPDDDLLETLERELGENNAEACRRIVRRSAV